MSLFSWLTGGKGAAEKAADGIYNGLDKMFYTDEEKADAAKARGQLYIEYQKATMPQNVARRLIALIVMGVWAFVVVLAALVGAWLGEYADYLLELLFKAVMPLAVVVISFYYYKRIKQVE